MEQSILLVFAHPDDESFGVAGTVAKYTQRGIPVDLICATRGEKGTRLDVPDSVSTGAAREAELRAAAAIIRIRDIYFLGYIDGELGKAGADEVTGKVLAIMQRLRPDTVITFGPDGITGHPDHIAIGEAATRAFDTLRRRGNVPRRLYYVTLPQSAVPDAGESGIATRPDEEVTTTIDISDHFDMKIQAIGAHRSQQDAREFLETLQRSKNAVLPAREFLYLVRLGSPQKETDLF
jgi:LmbE family N-acetylglucosaminyl deacetylase